MLCYVMLPFVTPCYTLLPLLPLVTPCYPLLPFVTLVTPCYPLLPLLPLVTPCYPCYPLLPLVTFVTPFYHLLPSYSSLGVHINGNLSWECHINEISKKIASGISAIKRIKYFLPFEILLNVYNSLVQPHFDYCNVAGENCYKNLSSKLQKLQNCAARVLTFSNYECSTSELFQNLKRSKLVHQHAVSKATMTHSIVNNTAPDYLTSRFVLSYTSYITVYKSYITVISCYITDI